MTRQEEAQSRRAEMYAEMKRIEAEWQDIKRRAIDPHDPRVIEAQARYEAHRDATHENMLVAEGRRP